MINLLLKNKEKITCKFPFTDELFDDIINNYNVDLNRLLTLLESNKIKVSLRRIKSKKNLFHTEVFQKNQNRIVEYFEIVLKHDSHDNAVNCHSLTENNAAKGDIRSNIYMV